MLKNRGGREEKRWESAPLPPDNPPPELPSREGEGERGGPARKAKRRRAGKEPAARKKPAKQVIQDESFFATIISVEYRNYRYYFELDNGQRWSTSDSGTRAKLKTNQKIEIVPGAFGASYLKNRKGKFRLRKVR